MVPPVLITRTRASEVDGEVSWSRVSSELQLDNFLLRDGCVMGPRGADTSEEPSRPRLSWGCDRARARDVGVRSAMTRARADGTGAAALR